MIHIPSFVLGAVSVALLAGAFTLIDILRLRRQIRRLAERAELARHQALPPPPAATSDPPPPSPGIQLAPCDVARPLPQDLRYRGHTLRIVVYRRRRPSPGRTAGRRNRRERAGPRSAAADHGAAAE